MLIRGTLFPLGIHVCSFGFIRGFILGDHKKPCHPFKKCSADVKSLRRDLTKPGRDGKTLRHDLMSPRRENKS